MSRDERAAKKIIAFQQRRRPVTGQEFFESFFIVFAMAPTIIDNLGLSLQTSGD